jgi:HlyD family secretion protein
MKTPDKSAKKSIQRHILIGLAIIAMLVGGLGGWASTTEISGAVIASGTLVVDSNVKKVQHPTGGVVGEILVRDGDHVRAGDLLMRLDDTVTRANLAIVVKSLDELAARQARLEAERDDLDAIKFPDRLLARSDNPDVSLTVNGERKLFDLRLVARRGQKAQLKERIGQLSEEVRGLTGQIESKKHEIELVNKELEAVRQLWEKDLVPISRLTTLERDAVRIDGERSQLIATIAQTRGKMTETELQIIQVDQDLRSEVAKELREIQSKNAEQVERKITAEDQLKRIDLLAPQDGTINQLSVHTVGGVVNAGEPIMLVVPAFDDLVVEARIAPQNIDQLSVGQSVSIRFSAFNQRTTPEIIGIVSTISADVSQDQKTNAPFYLVRIVTSAAEIARLGHVRLVPGMPVEVYIQSSDRTVMSFLVKPLQDQIVRAFRER